MLDFCIAALLHIASFPKIDTDAAKSKYAVVLFGLGGFAHPGGSS